MSVFKPTVPIKLKELKLREVAVEGFQEKFLVPRYITRIETASTHGWQVRFLKPSTFVADGSASAKASLRSAISVLTDCYTPRIRKLRTKTNKNKNRLIVIGDKKFELQKDLPVGFSIQYGYKENGDQKEVRFQYYKPRFNKSKHKVGSIYVGSYATITQKRIDAAMKEAEKMRKDMEKEWKKEHAEYLRNAQ